LKNQVGIADAGMFIYGLAPGRQAPEAAMREKLAGALREAAKGGEKTRAATLRLVLAALADREQAATTEVLDPREQEAALRDILRTMIRQRRAQIHAYEEAGRLELAAAEEAEVAVLQEFLPKALSEAEVERAVAEAIRDAGARSLHDLPRVTRLLRRRHEGVMDFSHIGKRVQAHLRAMKTGETDQNESPEPSKPT
jgi:uncharacterized protein YqeY